jgi:hypothetical protein
MARQEHTPERESVTSASAAPSCAHCPPGVRRTLLEVKHRWIARVFIGYALGFWVIVQVVDAVSPELVHSDRILKSFVLTGLAGMPIALAFGWGLGMLRVGRGIAAAPDRREPVNRLSLPILLALIASACLLIVLLLLQIWAPMPRTA